MVYHPIPNLREKGLKENAPTDRTLSFDQVGGRVNSLAAKLLDPRARDYFREKEEGEKEWNRKDVYQDLSLKNKREMISLQKGVGLVLYYRLDSSARYDLWVTPFEEISGMLVKGGEESDGKRLEIYLVVMIVLMALMALMALIVRVVLIVLMVLMALIVRVALMVLMALMALTVRVVMKNSAWLTKDLEYVLKMMVSLKWERVWKY